MSILRNEEIDIIKDAQEYLSGINGEKAKDLYNRLSSLLTDSQQHKKTMSQKANEYNKKNKKKHRIMINIYNAKKSGNTKRLEYWQNELKVLKEISK